MKFTAMFLLVMVFLQSALAQESPPAQTAAAPACASNPGAYWSPVFQFPVPNDPAQADQLWKVDFQELINKGRLTVEQANFLIRESPKAKESQGKMVQGYVIAFNSCTNQILVDYQEPTPPTPQIDQTEIAKAALQVAAADTAQQQATASDTGQIAPGAGPSAGRQIGEAAASLAGFAKPLALVAVPAAGFVGEGIQKGVQKIAGSGRNKLPQPAFSLNRKNWWKDF